MASPLDDPTPQHRRHAPTVVVGSSHLDVLDNTVRLLCAGPEPLAVDGRRLGHGLPRRLIRLTELSAILMHPATSYTARDEVWRLLVNRARAHGGAWLLGAVGVALPGLRAAAKRLGRSNGVDVQAELVEGFLAALATIDTSADRVCPRLCNAAYVAARAALRGHEAAASGEAGSGFASAAPPAPHGHPDFVLARAVTASIISALEADLIGVTRLEEVTVAEYAERIGQSAAALFKLRSRAEARLKAAIDHGWRADEDADAIAEATMTLVPDSAQRGR